MTDSAPLAQVAELFGRLLLREIDDGMLRTLQSEEVAAALLALDIPVPQADQLDALAVEYCAAFIGPADATPIVQSVHEGDGHESPSANAVRKMAESAGLELDRDASRAAAPDHLGAILVLWAELSQSWPEGADHLARAHLAWSIGPLQQLTARGGFYGCLAKATSSAIESILADAAS